MIMRQNLKAMYLNYILYVSIRDICEAVCDLNVVYILIIQKRYISGTFL